MNVEQGTLTDLDVAQSLIYMLAYPIVVECELCHCVKSPHLLTWIDPNEIGYPPGDGYISVCKGGCPTGDPDEKDFRDQLSLR